MERYRARVLFEDDTEGFVYGTYSTMAAATAAAKAFMNNNLGVVKTWVVKYGVNFNQKTKGVVL